MSYTFLDAYSSIQSADSSVVSGTTQRPIINIGSVLSAIPIIGTTANQSISGTVEVSNFPANSSISGAISVSNFPSNTSVSGTVAATQGTTPWIIGSVYGNIGGSVVAFQGGTQATSISGQVTVVSSISGGIFPISGSVAATITNTSVNVSGSVAAFVVGNASLITTIQANSIAGTYAEDAAHTAGDRGVFVLGVRNDNVSSFVGANLDYGPIATDSAGRTLYKPFAADEARLSFAGSVVSGSVTAMFPSVTGLKNYLTDFLVSNTGSVATLVTFRDGSTSILGFTIAPATGGSNKTLATPIAAARAQDFSFSVSPSTSVLYITALGYKAP